MSHSQINSTRSLDAPSTVTSTRSLDNADPEMVSLVPVPIFAVPAPMMLGTALPPGVQAVTPVTVQMAPAGTPLPVAQAAAPATPVASATVKPEMTPAQKERARKQKKQRHSKSDAAWFKLRFVPRSSEERPDVPEDVTAVGGVPRPSYAAAAPSAQPPTV